MKLLEKFLLLTAISLFLPNVTAYGESFSDITDHQYSQAIEFLYEEGVVNGYPDGTFKPDNKITRAEFLKILMEFNNLETGGENCYPDVKTEWFAKYVCAATEAGFVDGYEDGTFHPEANINFAEASKIATIVWGSDINEFYNDNWFHPYVKVLERENAIPETITSFDQIITRGEMAFIAYGMDYSYNYDDVPTYNYIKYISEETQNTFSSEQAEFIKKHNIVSDKIPYDLDYDTFEKIGINIYKDKNHVYYLLYEDGNTILKALEEIDAETFQVFGDIIYDFYFDKNYFYELDPNKGKFTIIKEIPPNFVHFYRNIFVNEKSVFYFDISALGEDRKFKKLEGSNAEDLQFVEGSSSLLGDGIFVYQYDSDYDLKKLGEMDVASVEIIEGDEGLWRMFKDKNRVSYLKNDELWTIEESDPETFEIIFEARDRLFAIDKNNVYFIEGNDYPHKGYGIGKNVDLNSLELIAAMYTSSECAYQVSGCLYYFKDSAYVYDKDFNIIDWADPIMFSVKNTSRGYGEYFIYGSNGEKFWYYNPDDLKEIVVENVDGESFSILGDTYVRNNDNTSSQVVGKDKNSIWMYDDYDFSFQKISDLDTSTFEKISDTGFFKDKNGIYFLDNNREFQKISGLDDLNPSLAKMIETDEALYLRDDRNLWLYKDNGSTPSFGKIEDIELPEIDNDTFKFEILTYDSDNEEKKEELDLNGENIIYFRIKDEYPNSGLGLDNEASQLLINIEEEMEPKFIRILFNGELLYEGFFIKDNNTGQEEFANQFKDNTVEIYFHESEIKNSILPEGLLD